MDEMAPLMDDGLERMAYLVLKWAEAHGRKVKRRLMWELCHPPPSKR